MTAGTFGYDDIIDLEHHVSATHPHMSRKQRAAQFSPFAALSGYDARIYEAARHTNRKIALSEDQYNDLDVGLRLAMERDEQVELTFFIADSHKDGGSYKTLRARIDRVDEQSSELIFEDGGRVPVDNIVRIELLGSGMR
jgi:hypothetical protein